MSQAISKETADLYRRSLPRGYQKKIAGAIGVSPIAVSQFLAGKHASKRIEEAILKTIAELREERAELLRNAGML